MLPHGVNRQVLGVSASVRLGPLDDRQLWEVLIAHGTQCRLAPPQGTPQVTCDYNLLQAHWVTPSAVQPGQAPCADADTVHINDHTPTIARHVWLNTFVGIIDTAFVLTDEEQYFCQVIVRQLLSSLHIPERGPAVIIPSPVLAELDSNTWSIQISEGRDNLDLHRPRLVERTDTVVSLEAWRDALTGMLTSAYPDLQPVERVAITQVFDDLLAALGVPNRAARFLPGDVVRAHLVLTGYTA